MHKVIQKTSKPVFWSGNGSEKNFGVNCSLEVIEINNCLSINII